VSDTQFAVVAQLDGPLLVVHPQRAGLTHVPSYVTSSVAVALRSLMFLLVMLHADLHVDVDADAGVDAGAVDASPSVLVKSRPSPRTQ